jgi:DNA-binding MarR family transcriptional regulator
MNESLKHKLLQRQFESPAHEALLSLLVASAGVRARLDPVFAAHDLTAGQYNVLRILRGARPDGFARCDIARRMVERAPDLTRLIDRLEKRGLVERARSAADGRLSVTRVTRKGLDLLDRVKPALDAVHGDLTKKLSPREAQQLSRLCERLFADEER